MGVASSPGAGRPRRARRSIRFTFAAMVMVPVICLVVGWVVAVLLTPGGALTRHALLWQHHPDLGQVALYAGGGIVIVLVAVALMAAFAGRISRDVSDLETTARRLADEQLPQMMRDMRSGGAGTGGSGTAGADGGDAGTDTTFTPPRLRTREIARTAAALTGLQQAALAAAGDEANLRNGVAQVFVSLARRNQSLLQRQLRLIDTLEQKAADPAALADLFLLDHLTTRMRRHAENLIILSGSSPGRSWSDPVPVIDVIRGAVGEVEDYQRIRVITRSQDAVTGSAVADMIHLLAELIENAAMFSPSGTRVEVRAERVANGFVVEIEDRGLGVQPSLLTEINEQLSNPPDFALADPDRLGLFVVGRLAARHNIRVSLSPSPYGGTKAVALIPHSLVLTGTEPALTGRETPPAIGATAQERRPGDALVLTGRRADPPSPVIEAGGAPDVLFSSTSLPATGTGPFSVAGTEVPSADSFLTTPGSLDPGNTTPFPAVREPGWAGAPGITPAQPAGGGPSRGDLGGDGTSAREGLESRPGAGGSTGWPGQSDEDAAPERSREAALGSVPSQLDRDRADRDEADRDRAEQSRADRDRADWDSADRDSADSLGSIPSQLDRDGAGDQDGDLADRHDPGTGFEGPADRGIGLDAPADYRSSFDAPADRGSGLDDPVGRRSGFDAPADRGSGLDDPVGSGREGGLRGGRDAGSGRAPGVDLGGTGSRDAGSGQETTDGRLGGVLGAREPGVEAGGASGAAAAKPAKPKPVEPVPMGPVGSATAGGLGVPQPPIPLGPVGADSPGGAAGLAGPGEASGPKSEDVARPLRRGGFLTPGEPDDMGGGMTAELGRAGRPGGGVTDELGGIGQPGAGGASDGQGADSLAERPGSGWRVSATGSGPEVGTAGSPASGPGLAAGGSDSRGDVGQAADAPGGTWSSAAGAGSTATAGSDVPAGGGEATADGRGETAGAEGKPGAFGSGFLGRRAARFGARESATPAGGPGESGAAAFGLPRRRSMRPGGAAPGGPGASAPGAGVPEAEAPGLRAGPPWRDMPEPPGFESAPPGPGAAGSGLGTRTPGYGAPEYRAEGPWRRAPDPAGAGAGTGAGPGAGAGAGSATGAEAGVGAAANQPLEPEPSVFEARAPRPGLGDAAPYAGEGALGSDAGRATTPAAEAGSGFGLRAAWSDTTEAEAPGFGSRGPGFGSRGPGFGAEVPGAEAPGFGAGPEAATGTWAAGTGAAGTGPEAATGTWAAGPGTGESGAGGGARATGGVLPSRSSGTYRGLPRRVRQASLPPQMRDAVAMGGPGTTAGPVPGLSADRSPEQARNVVASFRAAYQQEIGDDASQGETPHDEAPRDDAGQAGGQTAGPQSPGERQTATPKQEDM